MTRRQAGDCDEAEDRRVKNFALPRGALFFRGCRICYFDDPLPIDLKVYNPEKPSASKLSNSALYTPSRPATLIERL